MSTTNHVPDDSSPLTHTIPSQRVHPCLDVSPVPGCPGYTFGYTPTDHHRARSPLWNGSAVPNHLAVMSWRHIYRSITGLLVWDGSQHHYRICRVECVQLCTMR